MTDFRMDRRVSFADAVGLDLASIRIMTEGRDTPPHLEHCLEHLNLYTDTPLPRLIPEFKQPITDYGKFMAQLQTCCVALESLDVKGNFLTGMMKVRNLAYEKSVVVRYSTDDWMTTHLVTCYYVNPANGHTRTNIHDTFSFQTEVAASCRSLQFCVSFQCQGQMFWDNNEGANYRLQRE